MKTIVTLFHSNGTFVDLPAGASILIFGVWGLYFTTIFWGFLVYVFLSTKIQYTKYEITPHYWSLRFSWTEPDNFVEASR